MRNLFCCLENCCMFIPACFIIRKNPSVCSQVSKESRWELVQRGCNMQLQTSVQKCGVRKSDVNASWPMREKSGLGLGVMEQGCPCTVRPQVSAFPPYGCLHRRSPGLISIEERCSKLKCSKIQPLKTKNIFITCF